MKLLNLNTKLHRRNSNFLIHWSIKIKKIIFEQPHTGNLQQSYLHAKSEHLSVLKTCIAYSQTLRLKTICFTKDEYQRNCAVMKQTLSERKCKEDNSNKKIEKVDLT